MHPVHSTVWPHWASYKVSVDTTRGVYRKFFEFAEDAVEYVDRMSAAYNVNSVCAENWDWRPCPMSIEELQYMVKTRLARRTYKYLYTHWVENRKGECLQAFNAWFVEQKEAVASKKL